MCLNSLLCILFIFFGYNSLCELQPSSVTYLIKKEKISRCLLKELVSELMINVRYVQV